MENAEEKDKEKITPEKALKIFNKKGLNLTQEQAKGILEFMRKSAVIVIDRYLNDIKEEHK